MFEGNIATHSNRIYNANWFNLGNLFRKFLKSTCSTVYVMTTVQYRNASHAVLVMHHFALNDAVGTVEGEILSALHLSMLKPFVVVPRQVQSGNPPFPGSHYSKGKGIMVLHCCNPCTKVLFTTV